MADPVTKATEAYEPRTGTTVGNLPQALASTRVGQAPLGGSVGSAGSTSKPASDRVPGYDHLHRILGKAYHQAAIGKGNSRHAVGPVGFRSWDEQPILANARQVGAGGPAQQVMKKAQEAVTMSGNNNFAGAKAETLGIMVYAAALYKLFEEMEAAHNVSSIDGIKLD